jgi:IS30 family transposase
MHISSRRGANLFQQALEHPTDASVTSDQARTSQSAAKASQEGRADIPNKRHHARRPKPHPTFPGKGFSLTEGDLIIGRKNLSAIGTLVERTTNYTMLLHLPDGYTPELVRDALAAKIKTLPRCCARH